MSKNKLTDQIKSEIKQMSNSCKEELLDLIIEKLDNSESSYDILKDLSSIINTQYIPTKEEESFNIPREIMNILKKGKMRECESKLLLGYYMTSGENKGHYFGGGGVDGNGIFSEYVINYKTSNQVTYKIYETSSK